MTDLISDLSVAEKGSVVLTTRVFLALGGEFRSEPVSKQGGGSITSPYWKGESDACFGVSMTTSVSDIIHHAEKSGWAWSVKKIGDGSHLAVVNRLSGLGSTPSLALCIAALRWVEFSNGI